MMEKKLRIAIVSDLHCHPEDKQNYKNNATILFTDKLRDISKEHPVENLRELKENEKIADVDIVLCPGDFTNQSDKQGLISGWDYINEISNIFNAKYVYATLGNHDIDSRNMFTGYSFTFPKGIKKSFPLKDTEIGDFWNKGFTFIENDNFQILIINTTHYHTHSAEKEIDNQSVKGKIDEGAIEEIEKHLIKNKTDKIKIMLCHHHPKQHSRAGLGEHDFIENGESLLNVLGKHEFDLVVHGHKHDPWFGNVTTTDGHKIHVLSSGSFAATSQISYCYKVNYFHIVEISKRQKTNGIINTWNFKNKIGWSNKKHGFDPLTGFGNQKNIDSIVMDINKHIHGKPYASWQNLAKELDYLKYLLPEESESLLEKLKGCGYGIENTLSGYPEMIYNNALLMKDYGC